MSMLFTGEVAVPNIAAGLDKLAPILQNAGVLELKKRKAQAAAIKEANDNRAKIAAQMGGLYSDSHPFASQYMDQATEGLTGLLNPYLSVPGGSEYSKQIIDNWKKAAEAYKLNQKLTTADQEYGAMTDPASPESIAYNSSLGSFYNSSVSPEQYTAAARYQYEGLADEVEVVFNPSSPGAFSLMGYELDANGDRVGEEKIDLKQMQNFNNPLAFTPETVMVSPSSTMIMGTAIRAKEMASGRLYDEAGVTKRYADHHTTTLGVEDMQEDNEIFQYRYMAMLQGEKEIREQTNFTGSQEDLFSLFSLDPRMRNAQPTSYDYVEGYVKRHWTESMIPMIEYKNDDDDDTAAIADAVYAAGVVGKEDKMPGVGARAEVKLDANGQPIDQDETRVDMPSVQGGPGTDPVSRGERKTAVYNLRAHKPKLWDEIRIMRPNPEYAELTEEEIQNRRARGERVPSRELPFKIDALTFREDRPDEVEITYFGTDESEFLNYKDESTYPTGLKAAFESGFQASGLSWDGLWMASKQKWNPTQEGEQETGEQTTKVEW